jgi:hypothetical protein
MAVSAKVQAIVFAAFLSMSLPSNSFAVTGGLEYSLGVFNTPPAETTAALAKPNTNPPTETNITAPGTWTLPETGRGVMDLSLGRIEYRVSVGGTDSYKTTFQLTVMDGELGETDCTFVFNVNVEDRAGGPVATIKSATANGVDSSAFPGPGISNRRCQVFPSGGRGPYMTVYSRRGFVP